MTPHPPCRFCAAPLARILVDLGASPLANSYLKPEALDRPEPRFPLRVLVCDACLLAQTDADVPADEIFSDYAYFSSVSDGWVAHAKRYAETMTRRFGLDAGSQVVEIASNDGYLLQHFAAAGIPVLGIEPAANVAEVARAKGIATEVAFFGEETARALVDRGLAADLIPANNVLAHVPDIGDFVAGLAVLVKPEGVVTVEFPHLLNLIEQAQFDTIYHEHFSYLSLVAVERIFASRSLRVFDVEALPTHGGSLRVFACRSGASHAEGPGLAAVRGQEARFGLDRPEAYDGFEAKARAVREGFRDFLNRARSEGRSVAAYGAAAKGNTFLNYCGVTSDEIRFVADRSPWKQGLYLPGSRIPVLSPEAVAEARPDYLVILPWNLRDEVADQMSLGRSWGMRFVTAVPELTVFG